jgi:hypothetical protein
MLYENRDAQNAFIDQVGRVLSPEAVRQFRRCLSCRGLGTFPASVHVPMLSTQRAQGHYQPAVEEAVREGVEYGEDDPREAFENVQYIANPLQRPTATLSSRLDGRRYPLPSARIANGGFAVLTIEFDVLDLAFLEEQLSWSRPRGRHQKKHDCLLGDLDQGLASRFIDYRGVVAIYSGSKSIHHHFVFDTVHLSQDLHEVCGRRPEAFVADMPADQFAKLIEQRWQPLSEMFQATISPGHQPDSGLKRYGQLRRAPWGLRQTEAGHLLGVAARTMVPQLVLLDLTKKRSSNRSASWFLDPAKLERPTEVPAIRGRRHISAPYFWDEPEVVDELAAVLADYWGSEYPQPVRFEPDGDGYRLQFLNSPNDRNPASFVRHDFNKLALQGGDAPSGPFHLPKGLTLAELVHEVRSATVPASSISALRTLRDRPTGGSPAGGIYRMAVQQSVDLVDLRSRQVGVMRHLVRSSQALIVHGPEGSGKTRFWLSELPWRRLEYDRGLPIRYNTENLGFMAFAARSYDQAAAKLEEFQRLHADGSFKGILLRGFSDHFRQHGGGTLSPTEAAEKGYDSVVSYVECEHPEVYRAMVEAKNEAWRITGFDPSHTMLFTAQAVIHDFHQNSRTRAWLHPDYEAHKEDTDAWRELSRALSINDLIHDELEVDDLVDCFVEGDVFQARSVEVALNGDWHDATLTERFDAYTKVRSSHSSMISFERVLEINRARPLDEHRVVVDTSIAPLGRSAGVDGNRDAYDQQNGNGIFIVPRRWWDSFGDQCTVIMLTTEELPCLIARGLHQVGEDGECRRKFHVLRAERPRLIDPEYVFYLTDKRARRPLDGRPGVDVLASELEGQFPGLMVISNYADTIPNGINHMSAKGSNALDREHLVSIITFPSPHLHAQLCAIAQRFGVDDILGSYFRDQVFQSVGRNRGFRGEHGRGHAVVIHPDLERRIGLRKLTAGQRYELRRAASYEVALSQSSA